MSERAFCILRLNHDCVQHSPVIFIFVYKLHKKYFQEKFSLPPEGTIFIAIFVLELFAPHGFKFSSLTPLFCLMYLN